MHLKILLPSMVFADVERVSRIVLVTNAGAMGILPRRLDCAAAVVPGIVEYEVDGGAVRYAALDAGVMVKTGPDVRVSVRRAFSGSSLEQLQGQLEQAFVNQTDAERAVRSVLGKLESNFMHRFAEVRHE